MTERRDEKPLTRLGDAMRPNREPTSLEAQAIEEVRSMARELATLAPLSRNAYLAEIRRHTSGRQRHLATRFTPPDHPVFGPLMAMLDALVASEPGSVHTKHGTFRPDDLAAHHGKLVVEDGERMLVFPWLWPWDRKPNPETGFPGVRGDPLYRTPDQREPKLTTFRAVTRDDAEATSPEPDWWMAKPEGDE